MRIATFNAASVRARLDSVLDWLPTNDCDVLAIQETKVEDDKFPLAAFEELGYEVAIHGQKSYNGVAIASRVGLQRVRFGFEDATMPNDCRIISAEIGGIEVINTYVPNGSSVGSEKFAYKMKWLERFDALIRSRYSPSQNLLWLGDINIARHPTDVYDSEKVMGGVGHHPEEFTRLDQILSFGLTDVFRQLHPDAKEFSFWEFTIPNAVKKGVGWRIDHIYCTESLLPNFQSVRIDIDARLQQKPSDHTYVVADLDV